MAGNARGARIAFGAPAPGRRVGVVVRALRIGVVLAAALGGVSSCLIVDPPAALPEPLRQRPTVLRDQAVPAPSRVLLDLPKQFIVPVEVVDRNQTFEWRVFVDYDVLNSAQSAYETGLVSEPGSGADAGDPSVRLITFSLRSDRFTGILRRCHTIEFIAAERFNGERDRTYPYGSGDSIVWILNGAGDLTGCPSFDAGLPDADAGDAGG